MSTIWTQSTTGDWQPRPLPATGTAALTLAAGVVVTGFGAGAERGAALLTAINSSVRVNGRPTRGLWILMHRDEVSTADERWYFSAQSPAVVVPFLLAAGQRRPKCPLCRDSLDDEQLAVECPGCGRWYHEIPAEGDRPARGCWTTVEACRFCQQPTALDGAAVWRPDWEDQ